MSGPHPFDVAVISGQKDSNESIIAASAFLNRGWISISPISSNTNINQDLFSSLEVFRIRGCFTHDPDMYYAHWYSERIKNILPNGEFPGSLFWIALDEQGFSIAKDFFSQKNISHNELVYRSVRKLNLVDQAMPPYPKIPSTPEFWQKIQRELFRTEREYSYKIAPREDKFTFFEKRTPMTAVEKEFYSWYKSLHDNLLPWREVIVNIQSDWS